MENVILEDGKLSQENKISQSFWAPQKNDQPASFWDNLITNCLFLNRQGKLTCQVRENKQSESLFACSCVCLVPGFGDASQSEELQGNQCEVPMYLVH